MKKSYLNSGGPFKVYVEKYVVIHGCVRDCLCTALLPGIGRFG